MSDRTNLAYACDGSLEGVLCCIFDSYTRRELPSDILLEGEPSFYPVHTVVSDEAHALRVWRSLERMGGEVSQWVLDGWCSCAERREWQLFEFIRLAYQHKGRVTSMYDHPTVAGTFKMVRAQRNELHLLIEFLRFSDYGGALVAVIEPKALVLQGMIPHFTSRFPEETMMIYDKAHSLAMFYRPYDAVIQPVEELELPVAGETERMFRKLWRGYYKAIGIEGRYNPKCRMTHCAKHFWKHMLEMDDETGILRADERRPLPGAVTKMSEGGVALTRPFE